MPSASVHTSATIMGSVIPPCVPAGEPPRHATVPGRADLDLAPPLTPADRGSRRRASRSHQPSSVEHVVVEISFARIGRQISSMVHCRLPRSAGAADEHGHDLRLMARGR